MKYTQISEIEDIFVANPEYINSLPNKDIINHASFLMLDEENLTRKYIDHYLLSNNIEAQRIIEATSMDLLVDFAKIGLGIACVIKQFVKDELSTGALIETPIGIRIPKRSIGFVYCPDSLPSEAVKKFVEYFEL